MAAWFPGMVQSIVSGQTSVMGATRPGFHGLTFQLNASFWQETHSPVAEAVAKARLATPDLVVSRSQLPNSLQEAAGEPPPSAASSVPQATDSRCLSLGCWKFEVLTKKVRPVTFNVLLIWQEIPNGSDIFEGEEARLLNSGLAWVLV